MIGGIGRCRVRAIRFLNAFFFSCVLGWRRDITAGLSVVANVGYGCYGGR